MILAAGLGTRLRPLTDELPKPLVWIGDRPMIAHVAARLAAGGIGDAVVNTHHLPGAFGPEALAACPIPLTILHEPAILGTAGGVANASRELGAGDVVVWNGDSLADVDVRALLEAHAASGAPATLAVAPRARGEGTVGLSADGEVVRLRGERFGDEAHGGDFLGVQVLGEELRRALPATGCLVGDGYLPALRRGARVRALTVAGGWDDIGSVAAYLAANARWLARERRSSWVHPTARVAPAVTVEGSVIGAGAEVTGTGSVRGSVVWPGARAAAPLERVAVTAGGRTAAG